MAVRPGIKQFRADFEASVNKPACRTGTRSRRFLRPVQRTVQKLGDRERMAKMINLMIDDQPVSVPAGTLVVDAAKMIGNDIPVFCYHPKMEPVGMCRMCLVEIGRPVVDRATGQAQKNEDGTPKIQFGPKLDTACTTPVSEGMVVRTNTEKVIDARRDILEFLLTSHPLDCPICDKGGECPLQNLTMAHGPGKSRFLLDDKIHLAKHYPLGELIFLDRERCIQCARCVRFQSDIAGDPVIGFSQRGRSLEIVTFSEPGFELVFLGQHDRYLPGRRADHGRLPLWRAAVGAETGRFDLHPVPGRLQPDPECAP